MSYDKFFEHCQNILEERKTSYGDASTTFKDIAEIWNVYLRINGKKFEFPITDSDVAIMMCLFKLVRESCTKKQDNIIDAINYLVLYDDITHETQHYCSSND